MLNLLKELESKGVSVYIHNLGITLSAENDSNHIFTKLVITIMADLARMESEQLSLRIKSGIRNRKANGLHTGRKVNSVESQEKFLAKHQEVIKYLKLGRSYQEITKLSLSFALRHLQGEEGVGRRIRRVDSPRTGVFSYIL